MMSHVMTQWCHHGSIACRKMMSHVMTQWCHHAIGLHSCCLRGQVRNTSGSLTKQSSFTSLPGKTIVAFVVVPNSQVEMFFTVFFYQHWRARVALQCVCKWTFLVLRTTSLDSGFKPDQNQYQWAKLLSHSWSETRSEHVLLQSVHTCAVTIGMLRQWVQ